MHSTQPSTQSVTECAAGLDLLHVPALLVHFEASKESVILRRTCCLLLVPNILSLGVGEWKLKLVMLDESDSRCMPSLLPEKEIDVHVEPISMILNLQCGGEQRKYNS